MTSQPVVSKVAIPRLKRRDDDRKAPQPKETRKPERTCTVACNSCRKRKTRCTGQQPHCQNCANEDLICIYTPDRQNCLRAATYQNSQLLSFLRNLGADSRGAQKRKIDELLNAIEGDGLATASAGVPEPDSNQTSSTVSAITTSTGRMTRMNRLLKEYMLAVKIKIEGNRTSVDAVVPHSLINIARKRLHNKLHVQSDTLVNRVIDRTFFEDALKYMDPSDQVGLRFCSPFLVNALLALACLYTTQNATFCTPNNPVTRDAVFAREAERLLVIKQKIPSLPIAQGLAALYVYEGNLGKLPMFLRYRDYFYHAHKTLQKSIHSYCRHKQIRKPRIPKLWQDKQTSLYPSRNTADYWWFAYPLSLNAQESMKVEIFNAECSLAEIVEEILDFLDPCKGEALPHENTTRARDLYQRVLDLKYSLPERLRAEDAVHPAAILLQANFDVVLISILSPFDAIKESLFGSLDARSISYYHANSIMSKLWTFRALYTLQHEFWNIQLCSLCAFRVLFDLDFGSLQLDTFTKACQGLYEMTERFPLARNVLASLQSAIELQGLQLPSFATRHLSNKTAIVEESIMKYTVVPVSLSISTVHEAGSARKHEQLTLSALLMKLDFNVGPD
ncbi:hypothetical protein C7974DRAFT_380888 [Boeremia exigua]|uniref:uncharacterized protein n=1 Tax=Boeremia exigua TaxID=749465 RepID=UPI001E8EDB75|nr:uncharacterized protein C7974DRAFT_380888 [Boeremia exigua]KAH6613171.1 hypothetical protein C7974DRAFT_380888 [Boeremia exigua]